MKKNLLFPMLLFTLICICDTNSICNAQNPYLRVNTDEWERQALPNSYPVAPVMYDMVVTQNHVLAFTSNGIYRAHSDSLKWRLVHPKSNLPLIPFSVVTDKKSQIFVISDDGLWVSENEGTTFSLRLPKAGTVGISGNYYNTMLFSENFGLLLMNRANSPSGWVLYQSKDFGKSFSEVGLIPRYDRFQMIEAGKRLFITGQEIITAGKNSAQNAVYTSFTYSDDLGKTWKALPIEATQVEKVGSEVWLVGRQSTPTVAFGVFKLNTQSLALECVNCYDNFSRDKFIMPSPNAIVALGNYENINFSANYGKQWQKVGLFTRTNKPFDYYGLGGYVSPMKGFIDSRRNMFMEFGYYEFSDFVQPGVFYSEIYRYKNVLPVANEVSQEVKPQSTLTAFPNPMRQEVTLRYELTKPEFVRLSIYDLLGREVGKVDAGIQASGRQELHWSASALPSGVYVARLQTPSFVQTVRLNVLR
jgi:hypothetical protein